MGFPGNPPRGKTAAEAEGAGAIAIKISNYLKKMGISVKEFLALRGCERDYLIDHLSKICENNGMAEIKLFRKLNVQKVVLPGLTDKELSSFVYYMNEFRSNNQLALGIEAALNRLPCKD